MYIYIYNVILYIIPIFGCIYVNIATQCMHSYE